MIKSCNKLLKCSSRFLFSQLRAADNVIIQTSCGGELHDYASSMIFSHNVNDFDDVLMVQFAMVTDFSFEFVVNIRSRDYLNRYFTATGRALGGLY
eukprot:CAMPEP_0169156664 /NCGR_PEP_ID=MMETSP1015-20121227/54131_1 /TAXON_ID=342587 /ORGANISM="Karlodinium micrum, Strain CCMP2283" /LENGTH=95 /DNA_ID=CAMNT_0009227467 /DNA_START=395 /DNA_END=682 /DNA_ORIENTATION=-